MSNHIAFFATLSQSIITVNPGDAIVFDSVTLNRGQAYNETSGVFVAQKEGIYMFNVAIEVKTNYQYRMEIKLLVDGQVGTLYYLAHSVVIGIQIRPGYR